MRIAATILVAVVLGVAWVLVTGRIRSRRPAPVDPEMPAETTVEAVLSAYRSNRYDVVIAQAPAVLGALGDDEASRRWRARIELVLGHSYFEMDRFADAITHLEAGLAGHEGERLTGEARFVHCLGFAYQRSGEPAKAREIYSALLADADLDPAIRDGASKHLAQLDDEANPA